MANTTSQGPTTQSQAMAVEQKLLTPEERQEEIRKLEQKKQELIQQIVVVQQPSKDELETAVAAQRAIIESALSQKEQKRLLQRQKYQKMEETKPEFLAAKAAYEEQVTLLRKLREERKQLMGKIQETRKLMNDAQDQNKSNNISTGNAALDEKLKNFKNLEQLDKHISSLERRQATESLSLTEEKKLVSEISLLKNKGRAFLENMQKLEAERKSSQEERKKELEKLFEEKKSLETKINETSKELERLKQSKDDIRTKQEISIAKISEELSEVNLDDIQKRIDAANEEIRRLRQDFNQKLNKWYNYKKRSSELDRLNRHLRFQYRQYQRDLKRVEKEKELAEYGTPDPYEEEKAMCDNLIQYLQRLSKIDVDENKKTKKDVQNIELNGAKLIGKNASFFEAEPNTNVSKGRKTKRKGAAKDSTFSKAVDSEKLPPHNMEYFLAFQKLNVVPPVYVKDILGTIELLKERKSYYENAPEKVDLEATEEEDLSTLLPKSDSDNVIVEDREDFPDGLPIVSNGYSYRAQQGSKPSFAEVMQHSSLTDSVD
ncbi:uncharacterized protein Gasu_01000 [Galdieria sulphuraria]|uniref:Uncharacterized protein n=1 Tax=Galdieria sulphuraria TaxID=130081 RepID=M2X850_GALSU|nr:uncharacterized protein Gasu_01000 [Galdieria sulphuraria]EME32735.1 hypothetical protein Gasu_01000 [Galdieria sulphuraria]|eukprot:XP_005709255.1 hypothetical protein Gasu_01000 [Galdieria sulphuraria]